MKKFLLFLTLLFGVIQLQGQVPGKVALVDNISTSGVIPIIPSFSTSGYSYINVSSVTLAIVQGSTPANYQLVTGLGTNCSVSRTNLTNVYPGTANSIDYYTPKYTPSRIAPLGANICLVLFAAPTKASIEVDYQITR